jgi:hypothetical protein
MDMVLSSTWRDMIRRGMPHSFVEKKTFGFAVRERPNQVHKTTGGMNPDKFSFCALDS